MRRATRQRWIVLGLSLTLLALAALQYLHDRRDDAGTLLGIEPATVTMVSLQFNGQASEDFRRRDGHWWHHDGRRADDGRLQDLVAIAGAPVVSWRPASDFEAGKIGLAPPLARLALDGHTLEFGTTAVTGPLRYVRVAGRIALVPLRYTPRPTEQDAERIH